MGELQNTMAETILVTGGAGFIGSHTIIVLADAGYKVVVFDNFHNSHLEAITRAKALSTAPDSIHFMEGNICCQDQMDAAFAAHRGRIQRTAVDLLPQQPDWFPHALQS